MRSQVAANPATKWRIIFLHKTIYTGAAHQFDADGIILRESIGPVLDELKIDLVLQGHDHLYEVIGPVYNKQLVENAVSEQISVSFDKWLNMTGKSGGIFNVKKGTLYFLNGSAGTKEYGPNSLSIMDAFEAGSGMTNYFGLFSGRFGQTINPSFSYITVNTDTINVKTYAVSDLNSATLYDNFKIVKYSDISTDQVSPKEQAAISFYPVPVKDYAYIHLSNSDEARVDVYSSTGSLVKTELINGSTTINLKNLSKDVYVLKVVSGVRNYTVKFVKQ